MLDNVCAVVVGKTEQAVDEVGETHAASGRFDEHVAGVQMAIGETLGVQVVQSDEDLLGYSLNRLHIGRLIGLLGQRVLRQIVRVHLCLFVFLFFFIHDSGRTFCEFY